MPFGRLCRRRYLRNEKYLSVPAHGAIDGGSFLGFAEEGIVWMATPQLLAWVKRAVLQGTDKNEVWHCTCVAAPA